MKIQKDNFLKRSVNTKKIRINLNKKILEVSFKKVKLRISPQDLS